jgi:DNA ligase-1
MLFMRVVETSAAVASTASRLGKVGQLADCLKHASDEDDAGTVATVVAFLSGDLTQRQIGVGWASLRDMPSAASEPTLTVGEVDETFSRVGALSGVGSQAERRAALAELFSKATESEQRFLYGLLSGELRQGALDGVMTDAIAKAAAIPIAEVRRAVMLHGSLGPVAQAALQGGSAALAEVGLHVGRPVKPMLAETAESLDAALNRLSRPPGKVPKGAEPTGADPVARALREVALEWKIDGIRVQVHRVGSEVRVFTRTLDDITARVPEIVEAVLELPVSELVLDGEAVALATDGRPHPFQDTASRTGSRRDIERMRAELPLSTFFFDVLHIDGEDVLDRPADERHAVLTALLPETPEALAPSVDRAGTDSSPQVSAETRRPPAGIGRIPRLVTADPARAAEFFADAVARGHEGVVVKSLDTPYSAGRRGAGWIKVKPRHTLDLVILAAEWGHGRRRGWLSNLHLGARDPRTGEFVMLGKTFKGLTDKLLTWQTEQFLARAVEQDDWMVRVKPDLVVEVAFDGVQRSSRYPGGVTLRFARVLRYRPDKPPEEADTIDTVRLLGGFPS